MKSNHVNPYWLLATLLTVSVAPLCLAQRYTFTNIADTRGGFQILGATGSAGIAINDQGRVAFHGSPSASPIGVYSGDGGALTTVVPPSIGQSVIQVNSINSSGTVVFRAILPGGQAIQAGDGGPLRTVAQPDGNPYSGFRGLASINESGTTAYVAVQGNSFGVFATTAGRNPQDDSQRR